jgi:hypothetical protein
MVKSVRYEDIGHGPHPEGYEALSPDYIESDIGKFEHLTATVFGYQIDELTAIRMIHFLSGFITDSVESRTQYEIDKLNRKGR